LDAPIQRNNAVNALLHIWGYFNQVAESGEKKRFFATLEKYQNGMVKEAAVKHQLLKLAQKYNEAYILQSYYLLG
jgi:UV DNA damage endonuclease